MPAAPELGGMYREAWGEELGDIRWFEALALYKFSIITCFNVMLHRRGKRPDPMYEGLTDTIVGMIDEGIDLLDRGL